MIVLRVGKKKKTHTKRPGSSTRVNGNFIKLKTGIYISGQEVSKMQGLLPSRSRRNIKAFPAPRAGSARGGRHGPTAKTLNTSGITITKRTRFLLSYPLKPELEQRLQEAGGHTALRIARREGKKLW